MLCGQAEVVVDLTTEGSAAVPVLQAVSGKWLELFRGWVMRHGPCDHRNSTPYQQPCPGWQVIVLGPNNFYHARCYCELVNPVAAPREEVIEIV